MIQYTAKRSLLPWHVSGNLYPLDLPLMEAQRSRDVEKNVIRAVGGTTETLYHHADTKWALEFAPIAGDDIPPMVEFLDSTAGGEAFLVWIYGVEADPINVVRADEGYQPAAFLRTGRREADPYTVRITVREET